MKIFVNEVEDKKSIPESPQEFLKELLASSEARALKKKAFDRCSETIHTCL